MTRSRLNRPTTATAFGLAALGLSLLTAGCEKGTSAPPPTSPPADAVAAEPAATAPQPLATEAEAAGAAASAKLATVLAGEQRSADNKARDGARHPAETLQFFGVEPQHTVVELWPGGGWYTEILAPYTQDSGKLIVTLYDPKGPENYYGTAQAGRMLDRFAAESASFGDTAHVVVPQKITFKTKGKDKGKVDTIEVLPFSLGDPGSADVVLTFRNSHGWFARGAAPLVYGEAFKVLKPGGVLGVVQHRAAEGSDPEQTAKGGYLPQAALVEAVTAAGFVLEEASEINANPKDTRDYPGGVWTLPPSLSAGDKDRDKYVEIGESDRMTLRFRKPAP